MPRDQFGRYEIVRILGAGAFAAVYAAHDPALDATVAVKVLGDNHCVDPDVRARFIKEARLLRRIGTDRIVSVFDIGERDGQPYFVMELVAGGTLGDRMQRFGPADRATVGRIVEEVAACLTAIHRAGIVHRDLKPSNILVRRISGSDRPDGPTSVLEADEQLVLGDFGIARELDASNLTRAVGTEGYMAPEQRTPAASIDQRADIYAATAIVAALVIPGRHVAGSTAATRTNPIESLSPDLRAALQRGMAVDPDHRPASAAEWRAMMRSALMADVSGRPPGRPGEPVPLSQPVPPSEPIALSETVPSRSPAPTSDPENNRRRRRRLALVAPAVVVALILGLVTLIAALADGEPRIVGPEDIGVGQPVVYRAETSPGAEYFWVDWDGVRHDQPALQVEPSGPGVLPITLTEVVDGEQRSAELVIKVRE